MNYTSLIIFIEQCFLYMPLVVGAYCSLFLMKLPDISIEASFIFGALCSVKIVELAQCATPAGFLMGCVIAACAGALVGALVSFFTQKYKVPYLLSAIVCIGLVHGVYQLILGTSHYSLTTSKMLLRLVPFVNQFPEFYTLGVVALIAVVSMYLFLKTQLGVACAVYGDNPGFFKNYRTSTHYVVIAGVMISNAYAGVAGYCTALMNGFVDTSMGLGIPLLIITALMLGSYTLRSSKPINIGVPLCGVAAYIAIQQILVSLGLGSRYFTMIQACIVLGILVFRSRSSSITLLQNQGE